MLISLVLFISVWEEKVLSGDRWTRWI